jgi:hypothetical protein
MSDYNEHLITQAGGDGERSVSDDFITANKTESGAIITQITGGLVAAEIRLDPAQARFVLDQLGPSITSDAERYNQRGDYDEVTK